MGKRRRHRKPKTNPRGRWPNDTPTRPVNRTYTPTTRTTTAYAMCEHFRDRVVLLDGVMVYASAWSDVPNWLRWADPIPDEWAGISPDIGFYMDNGWASRKRSEERRVGKECRCRW